IMGIGIPLIIVFAIAERFVARVERGEINRQIEYIKLRERENAEAEKSVDPYAEEQAVSAETDGRAESGVGEKRASEAENAVLQALRREKDLKKRADAMRRYILCDVLICAFAVAFFACMFIPFVTIFGEKFGIWDYVKETLNSGRETSEIGLAVQSFFGIDDQNGTAILWGKSFCAVFMVFGPVLIGVRAIIRSVRLMIAYRDCEKNIETQAVVLSMDETFARKPRKQYFFSSIVVMMGLSVFAFWILYSHLNGDDVDLGELYSVSPVTLILYLVCVCCFIGLNAYQYFAFRENKQLTEDKLYVSIYRSDAPKK
ncbi:MAG: hypothetical protein ACI4NG_05325, partial [Candidatus Gallimonas sp.]